MTTEQKITFISNYDNEILDKYVSAKRQNVDFAKHFIDKEYEYWNKHGTSKQFAPEPID